MSTVYDWSPVFNAINGRIQDSRYQNAVQGLIGNPQVNPVTVTPQVNSGSNGLPLPPSTGMPQAAGATPLNDPSRAAAMNAPSQSYSGPLGQQMGYQGASSLSALLKGMPASMGLPLLAQTAMGQIDRQNKLQDYQAQSGIEEQRAKDLSQFNAKQDAFTPIPQDDPAYAGYRPGTILGRNSVGATKELQLSDVKSAGAMQQEKDLLKAKEDADIAKTQAMYGIGPNGQQADFTKPLTNSANESVAQSVANYDRSEATALSRYPAQIRAQIQARVSAINPDYNQPDYNSANAIKLAFAKGPQAQSIQSLNSTISHMDLMKQYVTALNNGDEQTVNALKNAVSTEFGGTAPTNAQAVAEILGPEMAKAVLPNGGTGPEREGFVNTLKQKASQGQLIGTLDTYQGLMAGQLLSLKKRYMSIPGSPKDFEQKFLLPETQHILSSRPEYQGGVVNAGQPGAAPPQGATQTKIIGGKTYHQVNGQWMQE